MCSSIGVSNERHEAAARRNGSNRLHSVWWCSARGVFASIQCKLYIMEPRRWLHMFIKTISSHQFFLVAFLHHRFHLLSLPFSLSLQCLVVLRSDWPQPCVFTFFSDLASVTSGERNTNWIVTIHRPVPSRRRSGHFVFSFEERLQ